MYSPPISLRSHAAGDWSKVNPSHSIDEWKKARLRRGTASKVQQAPLVVSTQGRSRKEARLEAVLFVAEGALSARKLAQFATLSDHKEARVLVDALNEAYQRSQCSFRIECVAGGFRMLTRPEFASWLDKLHDRKAEVQLSSPAMETLTIVAYRQPVTRADIEAVRGVQSTEILKLLMEKGLVRITGEDDSLGRPYLYGTTNLFLESFGLSSLKDLPMREEFEVNEEPVEEEASEIEDVATVEEVATNEIGSEESGDAESEDAVEEAVEVTDEDVIVDAEEIEIDSEADEDEDELDEEEYDDEEEEDDEDLDDEDYLEDDSSDEQVA